MITNKKNSDAATSKALPVVATDVERTTSSISSISSTYICNIFH